MGKLVISLLMLASAVACGRALMTEIAPPDEAAYIVGMITERDNRFVGTLSARVLESDAPSAERAADVMLDGSPGVVWRDGRRASIADLQVGRVISVWVGEGELRSNPPVVSAEYIIIER